MVYESIVKSRRSLEEGLAHLPRCSWWWLGRIMYVKNEAVVVRLYRQWWRYAEGPFNDEAVKGQCTGCCRRRGSGYQRAAHRCARLVPHMAGLTRCLHQSHITLRDPSLSALCVGATSDLCHATASSTTLYSGYHRHRMHANQSVYNSRRITSMK